MNARSTYLNVACKGGQQKSGPKPASLRLRNSRSAGTFMVAAPSTGTNNRDVIGGSRGPSVRTFPRQKRDGQSLGSNCVHNKATDCRSSTFGFRMPTLCDRLSRGWGVWPRPQARCSSLSTQPSSVCPCTRRHRGNAVRSSTCSGHRGLGLRRHRRSTLPQCGMDVSGQATHSSSTLSEQARCG